MIDVFTSININYLAKARVLAHSLRKFEKEIQVHVMLSDKVPEWLDIEQEPFDSIITIDDLGMEEGWIFEHSVVELCTAVKPFCFKYLLDKYNSEKLFYFDPDVVIFSEITSLKNMLDEYSILLTPHVSMEDDSIEAVIDNETSSMRHGIYNLGFLGIRNDDEGRRLVEWWASRLKYFCHDNIPFGIFTDQRWMDFVPAFFEKFKIIRDPIYNVATWNYSTRNLTGSIESGIMVDGSPICFHHFSGIDNNASIMMLEKYAKDMPVAWELDKWYKDECNKHGQLEVSKHPWSYGFYDNHEAIPREVRLLYRNQNDLQEEFNHPFAVNTPGRKGGISFYKWLKKNEVRIGSGVKAPLIPFHDFMDETMDTLIRYFDGTPRIPTLLKRLIIGIFKQLHKFVKRITR